MENHRIKHSAVLFCFTKISKFWQKNKSFNKITLIGELSFQFSKVYTETLKLLNTAVIGDSCLPRRVNLWLGVGSNHWHTAFKQMLYREFLRIPELPQPYKKQIYLCYWIAVGCVHRSPRLFRIRPCIVHFVLSSQYRIWTCMIFYICSCFVLQQYLYLTF